MLCDVVSPIVRKSAICDARDSYHAAYSRAIGEHEDVFERRRSFVGLIQFEVRILQDPIILYLDKDLAWSKIRDIFALFLLYSPFYFFFYFCICFT